MRQGEGTTIVTAVTGMPGEDYSVEIAGEITLSDPASTFPGSTVAFRVSSRLMCLKLG